MGYTKPTEMVEIDFIEDQFEGEIWKEVDCLGIKKNTYRVSNYGRVYSLRSNQYMKPIKRDTGYYHIKFRMNPEKCKSKAKQIYVHQLIATVFIPNDDPKHRTQVNHIDGDKSNNRVDNLEWMSPIENTRHSMERGLRQTWNNRVLTEATVIKICELHKQGLSRYEIAEAIWDEVDCGNKTRHNMYDYVWRVLSGRDWRAITQKYLDEYI